MLFSQVKLAEVATKLCCFSISRSVDLFPRTFQQLEQEQNLILERFPHGNTADLRQSLS